MLVALLVVFPLGPKSHDDFSVQNCNVIVT